MGNKCLCEASMGLLGFLVLLVAIAWSSQNGAQGLRESEMAQIIGGQQLVAAKGDNVCSPAHVNAAGFRCPANQPQNRSIACKKICDPCPNFDNAIDCQANSCWNWMMSRSQLKVASSS